MIIWREKKSEPFVKKMYVSVGPRRGRPVVNWKDRVKEYMHERVADGGGEIELARMECVDRERWRLRRLGRVLNIV